MIVRIGFADRVCAVSKQWLQIILIWVGVLVSGILTLVYIEPERTFTFFAGIAGASIALVSIEHLVSAKAKDTVRQQVYVAAGSFAILGVLTLFNLLG
ncbi:MAG: hypothetical protein RIS08_299 [Actinomycetota bacterium]|jgi:hypothetical protein